VLYAALNFLEEQEFITSFWQKLQGRGRPRRMLRLNPDVRDRAYDLAQLWVSFALEAVEKRNG
jgi:DNA-binding PadR family transcriptional regulator